MDSGSREQWLSIVLAEYNSLRSESLASMQHQQSTLALGTAAIGVLLGFGLTTRDPARLILLMAVVPTFATAVYVLYAIEFSRMVRVGRYIDALEIHVNQNLEAIPPALGWEGWLDGRGGPGRKAKPRLPFYWAVPLLFWLEVFGSIVIGLTLTPRNAEWILGKMWLALIFGLLSLGTIVWVSLSLLSSRSRYDDFFQQEWRRQGAAPDHRPARDRVDMLRTPN